MGVRRESVVLDLEGNFARKTAEAAVAAELLDGRVKSLGNTNVSTSRQIDRTTESNDRFAKNADRSGRSIDQFSGRLGLLAEAAVTLGPALIPLGASTIPVLTGALAGLGSAAGGIGVAILAFKGLGDGIKALDAYNLAPTIQNLDKLRQTEQALGPAGTQFLHYIDALEPQLKSLQNLARAGLFPGVEAGLTDLLQRLPLVRGVVTSLSTEMGTLAAEAGHSLSSSEWRPFFQYVRSTAAPTLDAFAHSAGNVALGLANLLVAFDPLSQRFTGGLEQMTASFADWSKHLDTNQGFQHFLAYVTQEGPRAMAFLGALGHALIAVVKAGQPWGDFVLSVLTPALRVLGEIADSKAGPVLYELAAAMMIYGRATQVAAAAQTKFAASSLSRAAMLGRSAALLGLVAASSTDYTDKLGLAHTATDAFAGGFIGGPIGAGLGAGIGLYQDLTSANDSLATSVKQVDDAIASGSIPKMKAELASVNTELAALQSVDNGKFVSSWSEAFHALSLGNIKTSIKAGIGDLTGETAKLTERQHELKTSLQEGGGAADLFGHDIGLTAKQMDVAAGNAKSLSGALAELNGWFDKRQAVRDYRKDVAALAKALKDGFQPKDAETLDTLGRGIIQVANSIKDPATRNNFLEGARKQLEDISKNSGPAAQKAIQRVVDQFDKQGLTHPPPVKLTADTSDLQAKTKQSQGLLAKLNRTSVFPMFGADDSPFQKTYGTVKQNLAAMDRARATAHVAVDPGNSFSILGTIKADLASIHDKTVTVRTVHTGGPGPQPAGSADGSTVPHDRLPYADRYLYLLAPGEEVISNRHGQADRHRSLLKAINAGRMADGGTAGSHGANQILLPYVKGIDTVTSSLKALHMAADAETKALSKAKTQLGNIRSNESALSSTVAGTFGLDQVFATSAASSNPWAAGASGGSFNPTANLNAVSAAAQGFISDVKTLQGKGVSGAALQAILSQGPQVVHVMAQMSATDLSAEVSAFNQASALVSQASALAGTAVYGSQDAAAVKELKGMRKDLHVLEHAVKAADKANKAGHKKTAHAAAHSGSNAAAAARRRSRPS